MDYLHQDQLDKVPPQQIIHYSQGGPPQVITQDIWSHVFQWRNDTERVSTWLRLLDAGFVYGFPTSNGDFHLKNDCESELFFYPDATLRKVNTFPRRFRK